MERVKGIWMAFYGSLGLGLKGRKKE